MIAHKTTGGAFIVAACLAAAATSPGPALAQQGPLATNGGPRLGFRGCQYFEHAHFDGARRSIGAGVSRNYVGDNWNDQISSIACYPGCAVTVYEHRDFAGARVRWASSILYVGDAWNDQISSLRVTCA